MKRYKFEIYKASDGFRWRLKARNGKIIADSGEAYQRRASAHKSIEHIIGAKYSLVSYDDK